MSSAQEGKGQKRMKQSKLSFIISGVSMLCVLGILALAIVYISFSGKEKQAKDDRFDLSYNANRFMNGSSTLTDAVRAYAATGEEQYYEDYMNELEVDKNRDIGLENLREIGITADGKSGYGQRAGRESEPCSEVSLRGTVFSQYSGDTQAESRVSGKAGCARHYGGTEHRERMPDNRSHPCNTGGHDDPASDIQFPHYQEAHHTASYLYQG